jgi:hypothetical protein
MARKGGPQSTSTTIKTTIGFLSGGEKVGLESVGHEMWLTLNGVRIAKRGRPGRKAVKRWIPTQQGWMVRDTNGPLAIQIMHNGVPVDWTAPTTPKHDV